MSAEEASAALYKDGDIVWVKLGPSWWPGEAKNLGSLPEDVATFKKPPLVVVKFFDEDLYEYVRSWSNIYPYNCEKKNEFIRKGLAAYRAKAPHMEKFPKDVSTAEVKIDGNPNILSDPEFMPRKKFNLNDLFQKQSPKMKKSKDRNKSKSTIYKDTTHITHRRFLGTDSLNDYRAYICIQYPGKDRTSGDPEDDEVIRINTEPEQEYRCYTCTFATKRLEVMIMHRKSHLQGVYVSTTPRKYKSPTVKRQKKDRPKIEGPKEKKKKVQIPENREESPRAQSPPKEVKPTESKELTSELLAEWDDDEEEEGENMDLSFQSEAMESSSICEPADKVEKSSGVSVLQLYESGITSPVDVEKGQEKEEENAAEHSTVDVEHEQNDAIVDSQKELDHDTTDTKEYEQNEQKKEITGTKETDMESSEVVAMPPEEKLDTIPERETRRTSRWDSRILEKRKPKFAEKNESKEHESSKEDSINLEDKELKTSTKKELKSSESGVVSSKKEYSNKEATSHYKTSRERDSKSPELKKPSSYGNDESESSERESKRLESKTPVKEGGKISAHHSKSHSRYDKKETKSTERESRRKHFKTSDEKDRKSSAADDKHFWRKDSKTSEEKKSKSDERESRSSRRRRSRSTEERESVTKSKNANSGKKESKISDKDKESKISWGRNSKSSEEKEARSSEVESTSHWKRKTPEKESKTNERRKNDKDKSSVIDPKTPLENDSEKRGSRSVEESRTSWRKDSKSSEKTANKSLWRRDSRISERKEGKESKAVEGYERKSPESQIDKDIKSCFDFDEEEEEEPLISAAPTGRKIPRVIPERRKSVSMEPMDDTPNKSVVFKDSQSLEKDTEDGENFADVNLENTFKELMEITKVPELPDSQNTLKCEQNFHNIKTIKFPDKASREPSPSPPKDVATKLTNPKKRFVKSFEDFEMMQNNIKRKEEEIELVGKTQQKGNKEANELDESVKKTVDDEVKKPQSEEAKEFPFDIETSKEPIDVQRFSQNEKCHHTEPSAQIIEEKTEQLVEQIINSPSNLTERQHEKEKTVQEGIEQQFAVMHSSEEKLEMIEKAVVPPLPQSEDDDYNNKVNDEVKDVKIAKETIRTVMPKAKLITPFKIQREAKKLRSTLSTPKSMKDVITNMTKETEASADLENKVHFANLKSKIMSKIIEESKLSNASKNKIMSLMESDTKRQNEVETTEITSGKRSHRTPKTNIRDSIEDQNKAHTSNAAFEEYSSSTSVEEKVSLPEETIPTARKDTAVTQEHKTRWSARGSHPKKDRTSMKETEISSEKSHIPLPQEASPSIPLPRELPLPDQSTVTLEEPPKPIMEDVTQSIVLEEIPLPEEIAVEDIPLPPEPPARERVPLDNIPLPSTEEVETSEPPSSDTEKVTQLVPVVEPNTTERLEETVSQDTTKPLTINLDNDNSESIFTSQSFLSSSMDFSPIGMASASLPENAICLPPKKSKKRKHSCPDDEVDWGSSKKINTDSHSLIVDNFNWDTTNQADSDANTSKEDNINWSSADKTNTNPEYSAKEDDNLTASKEAIVKLPEASEKDKANSSPQSGGEVEVNVATTGKEAEDLHPFVEDSLNWNTSEPAFESDKVNWSSTEKIVAEKAERWENEQQTITSQGQDTFEDRNDENEESFREIINKEEPKSMTEELIEEGKSVIEEDTVEGIKNVTATENKAKLSQKTGVSVEPIDVGFGDEQNTEIGGEMSSVKNVEEDQNQILAIDAVSDEKTSATAEEIAKKDSKDVDADTPNIMIVEGESVKTQDEFEVNTEEVIIDIEQPAVPLEKKDEQEHVDNITIVDNQNKQILTEDDNIETMFKKKNLQSNILRSPVKESLVEEPVIEETVLQDMTIELVMEETAENRTIELAMEEMLHVEKQRETVQEVVETPSETIPTEKSTPIDEKSPTSRSNEEEHANEVEIQCASNSDDDIKFSIQTNLSNLSGEPEISVSEKISTNLDSNVSTETRLSKSKEVADSEPNVMTNSDSSFDVELSISKSNDGGDIGLEKVHQVPPEMVHVEGNLTVVSEKDLADGQVEITPEQVISTKKPAMLSNFSMDFSDSTNDSCTNEPNDFDSKGTEFTSNAMTKEIKPKSSKRGNTYGRLELLNILEGNSDNEKKEKPKTAVINDDMCDFEDHIPSQIVCAKMLTSDMLKDDAPKTSVSVTTHKLLERLSESKNKSTTKVELKAKSIPILSKAKITPKAKSNPPGKPVTSSERVVAKSATKDLDDIEDVKAFVIHKDMNKFKAEEPEAKPVPEKPAGRSPSKRSIAAKAKLAAGKAKILQQTIITPAGEIIQPNATVQQTSVAQQKAASIVVATQPKQLPQPIVTTQAKAVVQPTVVKPATASASAASVTQPDDNMFDINSMPIVLSDELLTPECIEKMPIIIGTEAASASVSVPKTAGPQEKIFISTAGGSRPIVRKLIGKMATTTTPSIISQPPSTTPVKTVTKPRILSGSTPKVLKQVTPTMANLAKPGKYIIVSQSATVPPAAKFVDKKPPLKKTATAAIPTNMSPEPTGNKIMIVTNQQGQQQRLLLTPAQQRLLGYQTPGTKLTKTIVKGNVLQKGVLAATGATAPGTSGIIKNQLATVGDQKIVIGTNATTNMTTTTTQKVGIITQAKPKGGVKRAQQISQKLHSTISKSQKTILIKTPQGQTVRKIQGTDKELEKQVAEQLEAIRASSGKFAAQQQQQQQLTKPAEAKSPQKPCRRSNAKKPDSKAKVSQLNRPEISVPAPSSVMQLAKIDVGQAAISGTKEVKTQPSRPLNQLVIQDAVGNQTTITEGQILALPSETVDGQPQSYMLVTLDESGNLTPLNNEALMSLDPNLGLAGDLSNMVLQIDQGRMQPCSGSSVEQKVPLAQQAVVKSQEPVHAKPELPPDPEPLPISEAKTGKVEPAVEQKGLLLSPTIEAIANTSTSEPSSQQLIVTGDPIATQKFLESLSEGTTDLANILANADGNSILIQADGQQILINTNSESQMLFGVGDSTEGGGNPIFSTQPSKNQDILAAALADTDVFQSEQHTQAKVASQLSSTNALYPMNVGNVLETSLTLSSPIMTPLEVPSTNNKKIPDDEADILTQVPKNVDLPITITDPNISQTVANQQVASLIANELQNSSELGLPISEASIATVSNEIISPSYHPYSLPALEDSVDISTHKSFNSSMPLLNEDVDESAGRQNDDEDAKVEDKSEVKVDDTDSMDSKKQEDSMNSDGSFLEEEGRFTLGGEMCSSLSEPPPEMFDIPEVNTNFGRRLRNNITSINNSFKDGDLMDMSHADSSDDGSCEIPLQPMIIAKSTELNSPLNRNSEDREGDRSKYD